MQPLVSIITPVVQRNQSFRTDSKFNLKPTYKNIEYIIIDGTIEILKK